MTLSMTDDEVRSVLTKHIQEKFPNLVVEGIYFNVDQEAGVFDYAEAAVDDVPSQA